MITLQAMEAHRIVTGEEIAPAGNNRAARASFEKRQSLAVTAIVYSISDNVRRHLPQANDPKAMWDALKNRFDDAASFEGRRQIQRDFERVRPINSKPIADYFADL